MTLADPEHLEDEDEPEAEAMDQDEDGEGGKLGSAKEFNHVENLRLYLDPEIEFDSNDERAMGRAVRDLQECIRGFLLRFISWMFKPTFSDPHLSECPTLHHFWEFLLKCSSTLVHSSLGMRKRMLDADL